MSSIGALDNHLLTPPCSNRRHPPPTRHIHYGAHLPRPVVACGSGQRVAHLQSEHFAQAVSYVRRRYFEQLRRPGQGFRIDAELVGNAVILHRFETADLRLFIQPKKISAQSYHLAATTRISVNSPDDVGGCNRMVTYRFVGMKLLVRFDVDACLELPASISDQNKPVDVAIPAADERAWVDSGGAAMPRLIEVVPSGYHHPSHSTLLEIKSRHIRKRVDLADIYGQLVFSQNPRCYIARHNRHDYSVAPVEKYRLDGVEFAQVSKKQAPIIKRVAGVLQQIVELTRTYGEVGFVVIDGKMAVYKRDGGVPPLSNGAREMILRAAAVAHA